MKLSALRGTSFRAGPGLSNAKKMLSRQVVNEMKASEIVMLSSSELEEKLTGLKKDLFFLRMQHATNQLDNPIKIAQVRKDIARVKTVIRQKQLESAGRSV